MLKQKARKQCFWGEIYHFLNDSLKNCTKTDYPPFILQDLILRFDNIVFLFSVCTLLRYEIPSSLQHSFPVENMHFPETCFRSKNTNFYTIFKNWPQLTTFAYVLYNFTIMFSFWAKLQEWTIIPVIFGQQLNIFFHPKLTSNKK